MTKRGILGAGTKFDLKCYVKVDDGFIIFHPQNKKTIHSYLKPNLMALTLTDQNFDSEVIKSGKLSVVDFWATWCGPCRMLAPSIEQLAEQYDGEVVVGKVDVDANPQTAMQFGVRNLPTVLFIKDGEVVDKQVGAVPKVVLDKKIKALL